jgi:hypothetical protein
MDTKKMIMIALSVAILFTQEQIMVMLPNISFTVVLVVVFVSVYSFKESIILITAYVILDNIYMGGMNPFIIIPMLIGWYLIPISYHTILRRTTSEIKLAFFAFAFGFIYGWVYIPFRMIQLGITEFWPYLLADVLFEVIMGSFGFLTVLWLFKPLYNTMYDINKNKNLIASKNYK